MIKVKKTGLPLSKFCFSVLVGLAVVVHPRNPTNHPNHNRRQSSEEQLLQTPFLAEVPDPKDPLLPQAHPHDQTPKTKYRLTWWSGITM